MNGDYVRKALKTGNEISPLLKDSKELIIKFFSRETKFFSNEKIIKKLSIFYKEKQKDCQLKSIIYIFQLAIQIFNIL